MKHFSIKFVHILLFINVLYMQSHSQSGTITYNKKYNWANVASKMPYLSVEEKDRILLTWGSNKDYKGTDFILAFTKSASVYKQKEKEENFGYSWGEDEDVLVRNFDTRTTKDVRELLGKLYIIEGDIPKYKWKILNELKDVAGYVCMKAETIDTVYNKPITAWFTDKIKVLSGPEGFGGLPGVILELNYNNDDINIIATKIELSDVDPVLPLPKKYKGKKSDYQEFNAKKKKHYTLSIEGRRNPFWDLRY
jgi:GLPGLI family protein